MATAIGVVPTGAMVYLKIDSCGAGGYSTI
jgi:hypothetical protein